MFDSFVSFGYSIFFVNYRFDRQFERNYSLQPSPADQLQIPPTGSKDNLSGQVYSAPITNPFTILAQVMNFLQE